MKRTVILVLLVVVAGLMPLTAASNTITIYTMSGPEITTPILDALRAKYPSININLVKAGTGEILARLQAEKNNPAADILWGGDNLAVFDGNSDLFAAYDSPEDKYMVSKDPNRKWHAFTIFCQAILVNTNLVKPADYPKNVRWRNLQLLRPERVRCPRSIQAKRPMDSTVHGVSSTPRRSRFEPVLEKKELYRRNTATLKFPLRSQGKNSNIRTEFVRDSLGNL